MYASCVLRADSVYLDRTGFRWRSKRTFHLLSAQCPVMKTERNTVVIKNSIWLYSLNVFNLTLILSAKQNTFSFSASTCTSLKSLLVRSRPHGHERERSASQPIRARGQGPPLVSRWALPLHVQVSLGLSSWGFKQDVTLLLISMNMISP